MNDLTADPWVLIVALLLAGLFQLLVRPHPVRKPPPSNPLDDD